MFSVVDRCWWTFSEFCKANDPHQNSVFAYRQPFSPQVVIIIVLAYIMNFFVQSETWPHFEKKWISLTARTFMASVIYQNVSNELGYNNMQWSRVPLVFYERTDRKCRKIDQFWHFSAQNFLCKHRIGKRCQWKLFISSRRSVWYQIGQI